MKVEKNFRAELTVFIMGIVVGLIVGFLIGFWGGGTIFDELSRGVSVRPTRTPSNTPEAPKTLTPTPPEVATETPTLEITLTPTPPITATPPITETNMIFNGDFQDENGDASFDGWSELNGYWSPSLHDPIFCSPSGTWYLQMDRDNHGSNSWPPAPSEDYVSQVIPSPGSETELVLRYEEAHHIYSGLIELRLYGRVLASGFEEDEWIELFHYEGVSSPFGTGKCNFVGPPVIVEHSIFIEGDFDEYLLEIHGVMNDNRDGLLWGDFELIPIE